MKLFVIGNGFDLHHGLKSSYLDFRKFVTETNFDLLNTLDFYLCNLTPEWWNFEEVLGRIDPEMVLERVAQYLEPLSSDDYFRSLTGIEAEIESFGRQLTKDLYDNFFEWLQTLSAPEIATETKLALDFSNSRFLSFNYTDTLQSIYNIDPNNICFIHGHKDNSTSIVLGHSDKEPFFEDIPLEYEYDESGVCGTSADEIDTCKINEILDEHFWGSIKQCGEIIDEKRSFFETLRAVNEVYVLGHSLTDVDLPYFKRINNVVAKGTVWNLSYFTDEDRERHLKTLEKIGIDKSKHVYFELIEFCTKKLTSNE